MPLVLTFGVGRNAAPGQPNAETRRESIHGGSKASSLMPTVGFQVIPAAPFSRAWHKHLLRITLAQAIDQLM